MDLKPFNFKERFVELTQWVIPAGYEETIAHLLPEGCQKDAKGNYFIRIGESTTLFTCHLDTVSQRAKINHVFEDNWIKTDGTTILGGDNKAGVCILMYLIENNVPGTYYFFVSEECGRVGSQWALNNDKEFFKQFKRAIAFDRRNRGSIITKQSSRVCCSPQFVEALSNEFAKYGLEYKADPTGSYTDTYSFIETISECTNLSAGVVDEHRNTEKVDIVHLEEIAKAAAQIDWESLPAMRDFTVRDYGYSHNSRNHYYGYEDEDFDEYWYARNHQHSDNYRQLPSNFSTLKTSKGAFGEDLTLVIENVDKYFNLIRINDGSGSWHFIIETDKGEKMYTFEITDNVIHIEEETSRQPYYIEHYYINKNFNTSKTFPSNFDELWDEIKHKDITFKPRRIIKEQENNHKRAFMPYYSNFIVDYFNLIEHITNDGVRYYEDPKSKRQYLFELDNSYVCICEVLEKEPTLKQLYANHNTFESFNELWEEIRRSVPFCRKDEHSNPYYKGLIVRYTQTEIDPDFNKQESKNVPNTSLEYCTENISKFFNLMPYGDRGIYFESPSGIIYYFEIEEDKKTFVWSDKPKNPDEKGILGITYQSFSELWLDLEPLVDFKPRNEDGNETIVINLNSSGGLKFENANIIRYFNLLVNPKMNSTYFSILGNGETKTYFFEIIEETNRVYLWERIKDKTEPIIDGDVFKSFDDLWKKIKYLVDFSTRVNINDDKNDNLVLNEVSDDLLKSTRFHMNQLPIYFRLSPFNHKGEVLYQDETEPDNVFKFTIKTETKRIAIDKVSIKKDGTLHSTMSFITTIPESFEEFEKGLTTIFPIQKRNGVKIKNVGRTINDVKPRLKPNVGQKTKIAQDGITKFFDLEPDKEKKMYFYRDKNDKLFFIFISFTRIIIKICSFNEDGTMNMKDEFYNANNRFSNFEELWDVIGDTCPFSVREKENVN